MSIANLLYIIDGGQPGGAELLLLTIIKSIDKTQYKISFCLLKPSEFLEDELKRLNIPVLVLNIKGKWDIFSVFRLALFIYKKRVDIVHTCLYASNTFGRIAALLARAPVIIAWEVGEILRCKSPSRHCKIDRILAKFTDCIVTCSQACKDSIITKEGIPSDKIRVIHNCVDFDKFNISLDSLATRKQLGIEADEILIGNVGALYNETKGQEYLIKAMPQIINVYPKVKLLLVGRDASSKSYFVKIAYSLHIRDRVIFTGFRKDIPEIMNALDIYVCSSLSEGSSVSMLEAMYLKKAVIATRVGGLLESMIEGETGYLIEPKNEDSIAQAVISLLGDREKMCKMGEAGFKRVKEHFSPEITIKGMETLYKELLCKIHPRYQ